MRLAHLTGTAAEEGALTRRQSYLSHGLQSGQIASQCLETTAARFPEVPAIVDLTDGRRSVSYARLAADVRRLTAHWRAVGLTPGDVIVLHSPNCRELTTAVWAAFQGGFVAVPVVDGYRSHELAQVLRQLRPAAFVAVAEDRGFRSAGAIDELASQSGPAARLVLRGEQPGWTPFEAVTDGPDSGGDPARTNPDDPVAIAFTSGSASDPKGVVHSSRSLLAEVRQQQWAKSYGWRDRGYVGVTIAHLAGLLNAVLLPGCVAGTVVLSRSHSVARTAEEILEHGVTQASGPTTILDAVLDRSRDGRDSRLRRWWTGGMAVSADRIARAEEFGISAFRTYGMTEFPTITQSSELDSARDRLETDGRIPPGVECQVVDPDRRPVPFGTEGELRVRGPEQMLGYLDPGQHDAAVDSDGWLYTDDLGVLDECGCVLIRGRIKEIINRGGEKFSARDIEDVVSRHPGVIRVAVVAVPDDRYGEIPEAFVSPAANFAAPSGEELGAFLAAQGLARHKIPTRWHYLDRWPETPMGKPKRDELLRMAREQDAPDQT